MVLKPARFCFVDNDTSAVATTLTACGIETQNGALNPFMSDRKLQQHLPLAVCAEGCEMAEEQSDDEVRTSQVPERSEGKTKVVRQQYLPFTVLKPCKLANGTEHSAVLLQQHLPFTVLKRFIGVV